MKRENAVKRVLKLAGTYNLLAQIAEQDQDLTAAETYRHAARIADREAYKIKEKM